jgi:type VI secretion system protein ImpL
MPVLRGVYFASSTQVGTPFDRVMQALSSMFGIASDPAAAANANARTFFLNWLLREWCSARRHWWTPIRARSAAAAMLGGVTLFGASFLANRVLVAKVEAATADFAGHRACSSTVSTNAQGSHRRRACCRCSTH